MTTLAQMLSVYTPDEMPADDWLGNLPRSRQADMDAYRAPSPPPRELPFNGGTAYLPEEFMTQLHVLPRAQEGDGRGSLPTAAERAKANVLPLWQIEAMDKLRAGAGKPLFGGDSQTMDWAKQPLAQAPLGLRGGYQVRYTRDTPDPFLLPGGGGALGGQPLVFDGGGKAGLWHYLTSVLGAREAPPKAAADGLK